MKQEYTYEYKFKCLSCGLEFSRTVTGRNINKNCSRCTTKEQMAMDIARRNLTNNK